jgi:hypothetical protein
MMGFKDFLKNKTIVTESFARRGAVSVYAAQGKRHGDDAVSRFTRAKQRLRNQIVNRTIDQKLDDLGGALEELINGLISQRYQIGSVSAQITASNVLGS